MSTFGEWREGETAFVENPITGELEKGTVESFIGILVEVRMSPSRVRTVPRDDLKRRPDATAKVRPSADSPAEHFRKAAQIAREGRK